MMTVLLVLLGSTWAVEDNPSVVRAAGSLDFGGRRGTTHTANWDTTTYEATITADGNLFPWDFISFVGERGAISLCGNPDLPYVFAWSTPSAIEGVAAGDLVRVKGSDNLSFAHVGKIGLVLGSGPEAQRAWLSEGTILEYELGPEYVGYRAQVLGRAVTVRLSHLAVGRVGGRWGW